MQDVDARDIAPQTRRLIGAAARRLPGIKLTWLSTADFDGVRLDVVDFARPVPGGRYGDRFAGQMVRAGTTVYLCHGPRHDPADGDEFTSADEALERLVSVFG
jgi:hypothetical protein